MENKELHIIVLWPNARHMQDKIIEDINSHLQIMECYDIEWTPAKFEKNYLSFYGFSKRMAKQKVRESGKGNILLLTVMDNNPDYRLTETLRGFEYLDYNLLSLKYKYREWLNGENGIHSSVNQWESKHNICMLLGINQKEYLETTPQSWNGEIKQIKRDVVGCDGFKSLKEVFYVLNETVNYAILRNYEMLPDDLHGDIDMITDNFNTLCSTLNVTNKNAPVLVYNYVNGKQIPYDVRQIGDNYYCSNFERDMLNSRVLNENGVYVLSDEHYFYSLIYHALIQKKEVPEDYYIKLYNLFVKLGLDNQYDITQYPSPFDLYYELLKEFMKKNGYSYSTPSKNAIFNEFILTDNLKVEFLTNYYHLKNVRSCKIDSKKYRRYQFFDGYFEDRHLFVKTNCHNVVCKNEYDTMKKLYKINQVNFPEPYCYGYFKKERNVLMEYIEGDNLKTLIKKGSITNSQKQIILEDIENIARTLNEANIIHRNIKADNLILAPNGHLKLINYEFTVSFKKYKEEKYIIEDTSLLNNLGSEYGKKDWDDFYAFDKILNKLGLKSSYINDNIGKYTVRLKDYKRKISFMTLSKQIFNVKNEKRKNMLGLVMKQYKVITILGLKLKIRVQ